MSDLVNMLAVKLADSDRLHAITQRVGFVLWQLQELEGSAARAFVLLAQATEGMGLVPALELVQKAQSKTFGATVRQFIKAGLLTSELEAEFASVLVDRNWLVHKSKAESRDAIYSDVAASVLIRRLDDIGKKSSKLLHSLGSMAETSAKRRGVTDQQIQTMTAELLEQWHRGGAN